MQKRNPSKGGITPFQEIQQRYGLKKGKQIQLNILWQHIKQLIKVQFPGKDNANTLARYDRDWKITERVRNKKRDSR